MKKIIEKVYCKCCGKILKNKSYDTCYICRIKLNKKEPHYCQVCNKVVSSLSTSYKVTGQYLCTEHFIQWKQHHKACSVCHKDNQYFSNIRNHACDYCLTTVNPFKTVLNNAYNICSDLQNKLVNHAEIFHYIHNKFIEKDINFIKFNTDCRKFVDVYKKIIDKISNSLNKYINYWTIEDNDKFISCLEKMVYFENGYYIKSKDYDFTNVIKFSWKDKLYGWFGNNTQEYPIWENAYIAIKILYEFKLNEKSGKGEFLYSLLFDNIIPNKENICDICTNNNELYEMKDASSIAGAGRLLVNRKNWVSVTSDNFEEKKSLLKSFFLIGNFYIQNQEKVFEILNDIENTVITDFSCEKLYMLLLQKIIKIDKQVAYDFLLFMHYNLIFNLTQDQQYNMNLFNFNIEDSNELEYFCLINQLKYYVEIDAKDENLTGIIGISADKVCIIPYKFLQNANMNHYKNIINDIGLVYSSSELTKTDNKHHDRNKNRAPGLYFKK